MRERTILILGAGVMQLPAIRAAHRLGARVVVADGNPNAVGLSEADEFLHVDLKDQAAMVDAARRVRAAGRLDGVFTAGTDFSTTVAYVAEALGLPGTSYESARNATDKFRMRQVLARSGVSVPAFTVVDRQAIEGGRFATAVAEAGRVDLPVVVKPADSMGARGVVLARSWDDAEAIACESVEHSASGRVVVEGYIDGPEFSLDALVYAGSIQITGFADRHIRFEPYFIEVGHTIPTALGDSDRRRVVAEFERAIRAIGISAGAAKGDVKLSSKGPVIGEVAARLSGGYMSGWTYPLSSGVPLTEAGLRIALGEPPGSLAPAWNRTSAERAVISIPGRLAHLEGAEEARAIGAVAELFEVKRPGDAVRFPRSNVEKVANVITVDETRDGAVRAAEAAVAQLLPVLAPDTPETEAFLFGPVPDGSGASALRQEHHWAYDPDAPGFSRLPVRSRSRESVADLWERVRSRRRPAHQSYAWDDAVAASGITDWAYRTAGQTLDRAGVGRASPRSAADDPAGDAGRDAAILFWRAFLRGGLQGLRYLRDSLAIEKPDRPAYTVPR